MSGDPRYCDYRHRVREEAGQEVADCALLESMIDGADPSFYAVRRDACVACCDAIPPSVEELNPVIASHLFRAATQILELGGIAGCDLAAAAALKKRAKSRLAAPLAAAPGMVSCDVVVCCAEASEEAERALKSLLRQRDAHLFIHLVDDGGGAADLVNRFAGHRDVFIHQNLVRRGTLETLQTLVPFLRSSYVAIQDPATESADDRIKAGVTALEAHGAEFLGSPVQHPSGVHYPDLPRRDAYRRYLALESLICRRASLVDMGGIADRRESDDGDAELIFRAAHERRKFVLTDQPLVISSRPLDAAGHLGPAPRYAHASRTLRNHALGFPQQGVQCDVVLPFFGHIDYLAASLPSVLEQESSETIVHLIDDATPGNTDDVMAYWATHPRVRVYRNTRNIGQFASFNNIFPYLETNLIAIQDADDVSLPGRMRVAGNHLRLADADFFGGRFETFAEVGEIPPVRGTTDIRIERPPYCASEYPRRFERTHFLQNTTAVMRKGAFESLRGFSDYGDVARNKCGLDTEFFVRAFHAGFRFVMTQEPVVRYRWHRQSSTRNGQTGWGTEPRNWVSAENERRFRLFHRGPFDARAFGSLNAHAGITQRLK